MINENKNGMSFLYNACIVAQNWNMSQVNRNVLSKNLTKYRKDRGLTKEALSLALGFDNSYISKVENCGVNITIDRISLIANYLEVKMVDLFKE